MIFCFTGPLAVTSVLNHLVRKEILMSIEELTLVRSLMFVTFVVPDTQERENFYCISDVFTHMRDLFSVHSARRISREEICSGNTKGSTQTPGLTDVSSVARLLLPETK